MVNDNTSTGPRSSQDSATISEAMAVIRASDRYIAHAELERIFIDLPQGEGRSWGYELVPAGDSFLALVRAWGNGQEALAAAAPGIKWRRRSVRAGARAISIVVPKKAKHFTRFRVDPEFAAQTAAKVLDSCGPANLRTSDIQTHSINKPRNSFSFPASVATFEIGAVTEQSGQLLTKGRSGLSAFGIGMVIDEDCQLFKAMVAAYGA